MKVLFVSNLSIGVGDESEKVELKQSAYLEKYKQNLLNASQKDDWKYSGAGARFQGVMPMRTYEVESSSYFINAVCPLNDTDYIYSATAKGLSGTVSAIIKKNHEDGSEQFLINRNKESIGSLDYDGGDRVAASVSDGDGAAKNIAILNVKTNDFYLLSGGDSIDENAYFSKHKNKVYFDSRGIGRDNDMQIVEFTNSTICAITDDRQFEEVLIEPNFDVFCPKDDKNGNLYYMKKPYKRVKAKGVFRSLLDAILIPFWLAYGLFKLLSFFAGIAKRSSKKTQERGAGDNPTRPQSMSERDLYIQNEMINIEKEEKKNARKGNKTPGFAPRSIELWCMDKDGNKQRLIKGLLSYDIADDGKIVYSNGRYCFAFDPQNQEIKVLFKDKLINKIRLNNVVPNNHKGYDPFNL